MRIFAAIITAVLLLAGCGSSKDTQAGVTPGSTAPATSTTPTASSTPTAKPPATPATLTREQAAARYLALIKASNAVFDEPKCAEAEDFFVDGGTWPNDHPDRVLRDCHKRLVPLYQASIKALQTTLWPADARGDVAALISQGQAFLYCLGKTSKATSRDAMYKAIECFPEDDGSADRVRARFGLPIRTPS